MHKQPRPQAPRAGAPQQQPGPWAGAGAGAGAGRALSEYAPLRRIGEGVYSTVYLGWDARRCRREVLKVVRVTLDGGRFSFTRRGCPLLVDCAAQ